MALPSLKRETAVEDRLRQGRVGAFDPAPTDATVEKISVLHPGHAGKAGLAGALARAKREFKRSLKAAAGRLLLPLRPDIRRQFEACGIERYRMHFRDETLVERLVLEALIARHTAAGTADEVARSHRDYWASDLAVTHHDTLQRRFESAFLTKHYPLLEALDRILATGKYHTLCEIGCGAGVVTDYLAKRWPSLRKVIGLDLSAQRIELNRKTYSNPRLQFVSADASIWIPENAEPGMVFLTYDGVLEYLPEPTLKTVLRSLAVQAPVCFAIVEPIAHDYDLERETQSRLFGGEMSFSHNYPRAFAEAGFSIRWQQELPRDRFLMMVATIESIDEPE